MLWLAENKQDPTVAKVKKTGWWAINDIYWGYFDPNCFTRTAVPTAKGFDGSSSKHRFVGVCTDAEKAMHDGPIDASTAFCGCARCCKFDFANCLMKGVGGMATGLVRKKTPRMSLSGAPSQSATLEEFAKELATGQLRAVRVDDCEEVGMEGGWWLCNVCGHSIQATEQQAHATDLFEKDWWIVEIQWFKYEQGTSPRQYKLLPGTKRWLMVNALIRVGGLAFEGGQRVLKSGLRTLSEASRELIDGCM